MSSSVPPIAGNKPSFATSWWVIGGFSLFLILLLVAGFIGLYSLDKASYDSLKQIEAVDLAREAQIEFQNQFYLWKTAIDDDINSGSFRNNYHTFSYKADHVQDLLFNLKGACADSPILKERIESLISLHKKITTEYIRLLVDLGEKGAAHREKVIILAKGSDVEALAMMDGVAREIMKSAEEQHSRIRFYYGRLVIIALIALAFSAIMMSIFIGRKLIMMHRNLEVLVYERTKDLEIAFADIGLSEEKYRFLVEGTTDIVFSLDENLNFMSINKAVDDQLYINPKKIIGKHFTDILYRSDDNRIDSREFIREKLDQFMQNRQPVVFTIDFNAVTLSEPKEYTVRLEQITIEGKTEIIGRATAASTYSLIENIFYERQKFSIGNYLGTVEDMTHHLTRNLHARLDNKSIGLIRLALREIIFNAIEHGNLSISFDEKTAAMMEDRYFNMIAQRQTDPMFRDRKVTIEYQMDDNKVAYLITDEGKGFNHAKYLVDSDKTNEEFVPHGRGIMMATNIFTLIKYNKKGNSVLLEKKFTPFS